MQRCHSYLSAAAPSGAAFFWEMGQKYPIPDIWALSIFSLMLGFHIKFYISNVECAFICWLVLLTKSNTGNSSTSAFKGWKILATHPSLCQRVLFFHSERSVSNITGQLARKRERNGEANYLCELAKGHFKLCAHDIIMFMVNIIVGDSDCMAWEARERERKKRHQSQIENNLLRSEMRQLRGKDQKEKKKKEEANSPGTAYMIAILIKSPWI